MQRTLLHFLSSCPTPQLQAMAKGLSLQPDRLFIPRGIEVFSSPGKGLGLRATEKIPPGETLLSLSTQNAFTNLELVSPLPYPSSAAPH